MVKSDMDMDNIYTFQSVGLAPPFYSTSCQVDTMDVFDTIMLDTLPELENKTDSMSSKESFMV